jgi:hypothetical protein
LSRQPDQSTLLPLMPTFVLRSFKPMNRKLTSACIVFFLFALYLPQASAQLQTHRLSPSVVLVLNLVSKDRVQPVTGIVISDDGLVLVPARFVASKGELVVLDGGTDIIKNGRPAEVVNQASANGWALLSVKGLTRPGISLSETTATLDSELHLTAFPPAEQIANGLPPLRAAVKTVQDKTTQAYSISPATPQPYVSGPILDDCGYLNGISLTTAAQSIQTNAVAVTLFADDLRNTLNALKIKLPLATCTQALLKPMAQAEAQQDAAATPAQPIDNETDPNFVKPEVYNRFIQQKRLNPFQGATPKPRITKKPSIWRSVPFWLPLLGFIMLTALVWKAFFFFRLRKASDETPPSEGLESSGIELEATDSLQNPRSVPSDNEQLPDMNKLPAGCDGVLVIDGLAEPDSRFKRYRAVNMQNIDFVIGNHDSDIIIKHPSISASHARLVKNGAFMTLSDLGSKTGTYIKEVPCLKGEVMYFVSEDEVFLGDVQLRFSLIRNEAEPS